MFYSTTELARCFNVDFEYVLHVGAHEAEELEGYVLAGVRHVFWVEAQADKAKQLSKRLDAHKNTVICGVVWHEEGIPLKFRVTSNTESSSVYELSQHARLYPDIKEMNSVEMISTTLDSMIPLNFKPTFINLDIQGSELNALKGFGDRLLDVEAIYLEVNKSDLYFGIPLFDEITTFLEYKGFGLASVKWWKLDGWGDALFLRSDVRMNNRVRRFFLRKIYIGVWKLKNFIRIILNR